MTKTYILDVVSYMEGKEQTLLPDNAIIVFETENVSFQVNFNPETGRLSVIKNKSKGSVTDAVTVHPIVTNKVEIG